MCLSCGSNGIPISNKSFQNWRAIGSTSHHSFIDLKKINDMAVVAFIILRCLLSRVGPLALLCAQNPNLREITSEPAVRWTSSNVLISMLEGSKYNIKKFILFALKNYDPKLLFLFATNIYICHQLN